MPVSRKTKAVEETQSVEKKTRSSKNEVVKPIFDYGNVLDSVEKKFKLSSSQLEGSQFRMSTGNLVHDLITNGGYYPGRMYVFSGMEASGKTTTLLTGIESSLDSNVPIIQYYDYESALDPDYLVSLMRKKRDIEDIFGSRNKGKEIVTQGRVHYYTPDTGEEFFAASAGLLRRLPDKIYVKDRESWFLVFEDTKENKPYKTGIDRKLSGDGFFYIDVGQDDSAQAVIFVDSLPAMLPAKLDEDEGGAGLAARARMFAEHLPKVKSKLNKKRVILICVNQIRMKIGFVMGDPMTEPCGEAVKFAADFRMRQRAVSVPKHCMGTGAYLEEDSVTGKGTDKYRYIKFNSTKSKMGPAQLEMYGRIWMSDYEGVGHGFDIVFDTWEYLRLTGQIEGSMKKFVLNLAGHDPVPMTWYDFKEMILLKGQELKDVHAKLKLTKRLNIRSICENQLKDKSGYEMFFNAKSTNSKSVLEKDE